MSISFTPRSFGAQDQWIRRLAIENGYVLDGTFLDIGCANPIDGNNTYELERAGWRGLLVDINQDITSRVLETRTSPFLCSDAAAVDWPKSLQQHNLPQVIDYLSFDVDGGAAPAFCNLPIDLVRFRYMTIEHDRYRFGDGPRAMMRDTLLMHGYELLCPDVTLQGLQYEDWWVDPLNVDLAAVEIFRTTAPTECHVIVARR